MPVLSFRKNKGEATPDSKSNLPNVPTSQVQATDSEKEAAAAKLQALSRGKKTRFNAAEEKKQKEGTVERTHSTRSRDQRPDEGGAKAAEPPTVKIDLAATSLPLNRPLGRQLSRRVSFGSQRMIAAARPSLQYRLQQALEKCLGQLPCLPTPKLEDTVAEPVDAVDVDEVQVDSSNKLAKAQAEAPLKSKETDKASKLLSDTLFQKVEPLYSHPHPSPSPSSPFTLSLTHHPRPPHLSPSPLPSP